MNKKTLVVTIGVVLLLSTVNISMVILPVGATVSEPKNFIPLNPGDPGDIGGGDETYDLLIIAPGKFTDELGPLVTHKNEVAKVPTKLVTTSEIYSSGWSVQGRDEPEQIKYFIKNAHETWGVMYVLLVGVYMPRFPDMPVRYCYNSDVWGKPYDEECFLSDLYYADIYDENGDFSSWDTNNNDIFGEWHMYEPADKTGDANIDLYPDVYVGRLPCKFEQHVDDVVNKIITYETKTYEKDWFKKVIGISGDTYPDGSWHPHGKPFSTPGFEGEEYVYETLESMRGIGFDPTYLFVSKGTFTDPKDIRYEINKGAGFVFLDGHSGPASWICKDEDSSISKGIALWDASAYLFSNGEKLPVLMWGGCHTFQFDVGPWKILQQLPHSDPYWYKTATWVWECLAWAVVRLPRGGAIAAIGCTGLGLTKEDRHECWERDPNDLPTEGCGDYIGPQFFYRYISDGGTSTGSDVLLGETWGNTISDYLNHFRPIDWSKCANNDSADDVKTVQQWILFGDPSLKIGGYDVDDGGSGPDTPSEPALTPDAPSGLTSGEPGEELEFTALLTGRPSQNWVCYIFDWGDETYSDPVGPLSSGQTAEAKYAWSGPGEYEVRVKAWLLDTGNNLCEETGWSDPLIVTITSGDNQPPEKPAKPSGPSLGKAGEEYTYTTSTADPDEDRIYYLWDWGDETQSEWMGPYNSGEPCEATHSWSATGTYQVKVKAKDEHGAESEWSDPLSAAMPVVHEPEELKAKLVVSRTTITRSNYHVTFDASGSTTGDKKPIFIRWDFDGKGWGEWRLYAFNNIKRNKNMFYLFNDGSTNNNNIPGLESDTIAGKYYYARVEIMNSQGDTSRASKLIYVDYTSNDNDDLRDSTPTLLGQILQSIFFGRSPSNTQTPTTAPLFLIISKLLLNLR